MEERYVPSHPLFPKIVEAFKKAAETYGGDPIAVNLFMEHYNMAKNKIFLISMIAVASSSVVANIVGTSKKALEMVAADANLKPVKTKEEFDALPEATRLLIAGLDAKVETLEDADKLERAFEVLTAYEMPVTAKAARSKGVKALIRDLFAVEGAKHTVAEIVELTGGSEVSVKTALSDLRSATYCKPGEPIELYRLPSGHYAIVSKEQVAAEKAAAEQAKEDAKAKKVADKAAAKAEADAKKAADKAEKAAKAAADKAEADKAAAEKAAAAPATGDAAAAAPVTKKKK